MNKYLLMCAAAAVMAPSLSDRAHARTTVWLNTAPGSSCPFVFTNNGGGLWAASVPCDPPTYWAGVQAKKDKLLDSESIQVAGAPGASQGISDGFDLDIRYPFATGKKWAILLSENGQTTFILNSGTYCVTNPCTQQHKPGAKRSVFSDAIKALLLTKK